MIKPGRRVEPGHRRPWPASRSTSFASPKSSTFARPSRVIRMFAGLMSRCTMPLPCAASSAEATCAAYSSAVGDRQRPLRNQPVERRAVHQLHRDERRPVVFVDVVDGDDVRMVEGGGGAGFLDEAAMAVGIRRRSGRQHLDRHRPSRAACRGRSRPRPSRRGRFLRRCGSEKPVCRTPGLDYSRSGMGSGLRAQGTGLKPNLRTMYSKILPEP